MELWQMDVMGRVRLTDGTELSVVTGIDDHSRFCVSALLVPKATAKPVCSALTQAMRTYGIPDAVLTDKGKVFTGRFGVTKTEVLFDRICRENGVRHLLTAPYSPTTTGKVERLHKTMPLEFFNDTACATIEELQAALDAWVVEYNTERPHQGIGDVPPAQRFALPNRPRPRSSTRTPAAAMPTSVPPPARQVVNNNGKIGGCTGGCNRSGLVACVVLILPNAGLSQAQIGPRWMQLSACGWRKRSIASIPRNEPEV
jgi:hypothetical protein